MHVIDWWLCIRDNCCVATQAESQQRPLSLGHMCLQENDDASDDVDENADMGCGCAACVGIDDIIDYNECGDHMGCDCPHCVAPAGSEAPAHGSEIPKTDDDDDGDDADSSKLPVWTWGRHNGTPIKETPGV